MSAAAIAWFLIRVIPKPIRATYPCQQVAFPIASSIILWLLGVKTTVLSFFRFKAQKLRLAIIACAVLVSGLAAWGLGSIVTKGWVSTDGANQPMGTAKGIFPGRVAWDYDPNAALWDSTGDWFADTNNNQAAINQMVSKTVRCVGGKNTDAAAWDAVFHSFNQRRGKGNAGYAPGEKIAIKINQNNTYSHTNSPEINASPQMVLGLLKQLIDQAGVAQSNITVFDASRFVTDNLYNKCHDQFPGVLFVDNVGGNGRLAATYQTNAIPYSVKCGLATGLATCVVQADYVINMALLKGHVGQGVTLCAKNFYGATSIASDWRKNAHDHFGPKPDGSPTYVAFTDFLGHKDLGEKTLLFMIDALYGCKVVNGAPGPKWNMAPFNGRWPSSLFVSEDGVAIDSVALDFFRSEWPAGQDLSYSDTYLHEAAQADNPPSHTFYDPERDGTRCSSLGVHEHWNNSIAKAYSRNLGKNTGIELVPVHAAAAPGSVSSSPFPQDYKGKPFEDAVYKSGAQSIPGRVQCAFFDLGGEGVAYHDADAVNHGSGELNLQPQHQRPHATPYFWNFRPNEGVDISYAKDFADFNHTNSVTPQTNQLYLGWTALGEWCNYTLEVKKAGAYRIIALYSNGANPVKFSLNGKPASECKLPLSTGSPHFWNQAEIGIITFPEAGPQLLTFYCNEGNNFAWFDFQPVPK